MQSRTLRLRRAGGSTGSASSRRLELETILAEMLLQLLDTPPDDSGAFERAGNVDRLAVAPCPLCYTSDISW
jgi:hypothetical protein